LRKPSDESKKADAPKHQTVRKPPRLARSAEEVLGGEKTFSDVYSVLDDLQTLKQPLDRRSVQLLARTAVALADTVGRDFPEGSTEAAAAEKWRTSVHEHVESWQAAT